MCNCLAAMAWKISLKILHFTLYVVSMQEEASGVDIRVNEASSTQLNALNGYMSIMLHEIGVVVIVVHCVSAPRSH